MQASDLVPPSYRSISLPELSIKKGAHGIFVTTLRMSREMIVAVYVEGGSVVSFFFTSALHFSPFRSTKKLVAR